MKAVIAIALTEFIVVLGDKDVVIQKDKKIICREGALFDKFSAGYLNNLFEGELKISPKDFGGKPFIFVNESHTEDVNAALASVNPASAKELAEHASGLASEVNELTESLKKVKAERDEILKENAALKVDLHNVSMSCSNLESALKEAKSDLKEAKKKG